MRLIYRSKLLDKFNLECKTAQERYMALINAPTIDAVPVVRCAKCKNCEEYKTFPGGLFCPYIKTKVPPDGYCYMGEEGGHL